MLLTAVKPKPPARWEVDPVVERQQKLEGQVQQIGWALFNHAPGQAVPGAGQEGQALGVQAGPARGAGEARQLDRQAVLTDPVGGKLTLDGPGEAREGLHAGPAGPGRHAEPHAAAQLGVWSTSANGQQARVLQGRQVDASRKRCSADAAKATRAMTSSLKDAWGKPLKLVKRDKKMRRTRWAADSSISTSIVSAGPDGKFGTDDDREARRTQRVNSWRMASGAGDDADAAGTAVAWAGSGAIAADDGMNRRPLEVDSAEPADGSRPARWLPGAAPAGGGFGGGAADPDEGRQRQAPPMRPGHGRRPAAAIGGADAAARILPRDAAAGSRPSSPTTRAVADLPLTFADSITTWRLTASASSRAAPSAASPRRCASSRTSSWTSTCPSP